MLDRRQSPPRRSQSLDETLDFLRLLWAIEHRLQSTSKMMESRLGITGPQRLVLKVVAQFPGISAKEVANIVRLHPSTITGILQRLIRKGLLLRAPDPVDTRRVRLRVQPAARRYTRASKGTVEYAVARVLERLRPEAVDGARDVLAAVAASLEHSGEPKSAARTRRVYTRRATRRSLHDDD
ncbi:MAG TPA: MarR family winged helix-turn-helix transcriptional regulator [Vicinamibacterales bacterium]|nr:MarR family winged helix-turn-helix transcriptional regulator [Vicinamibacterales bacterium]